MRYLLLVIAILLPFVAFARFDFTSGVPSVVWDATITTDPTRFDFVSGVPGLVYDATYTAPSAGGGATGAHDLFWFD